MSEKNQTIFYESTAKVLAQWQLPKDPWAAQIAKHISQGTIQWQQSLPDGRTLHLLRVYVPVIQREEVFLGNVLLNDFFFKAMPAAAERIGIEQFTAVANDLESAYFLVCGDLNIEQLQAAFLAVVAERLPDLYFADDDPETGIHGQFNTMLTFYKANIEPFPVFVIPVTLLPDLLKKVGEWLRLIASQEGVYELAKIERLDDLEVAKSRRINVILSVLTFFFCQDGMEMQSFHKFLDNGIEDGRLSAKLVKQAFGMSPEASFDKKQFNKAKAKSENIDFGTLEQALLPFLDNVIVGLEQGEGFAERFYLAPKMLPQSLMKVAKSLTHNLQIGYATIIDSQVTANDAIICRLSGQHAALIQECHIIGGVNSGKYYNQSLKRHRERFSVRTAMAAYMANKRLGMQFDGGFPVPKMYNVIFHYGTYNDGEKEVFQQQLDYLIEYAKKAEKSVTELESGLEEIRHNLLNDQDFEDLSDILGEWHEPALETIAQLEAGAKSEVMVLGSGFYRLFIFILPQFRTGSQESIDFVQKRFSQSRLAAFTLLALMRSLCGADGPYYYQSLPRLNTGTESGIFYVQNKPEQADEALRKYGAIVSFARQVSRYRRGHSLLADWVLLAERLLQDPLGIFSTILRASPIRAGDDFNDSRMRYKRLSSSNWEGAKGLGVVDSTEYLALYEQLHELAKEMN